VCELIAVSIAKSHKRIDERLAPARGIVLAAFLGALFWILLAAILLIL
jgi:hypothetical protein